MNIPPRHETGPMVHDPRNLLKNQVDDIVLDFLTDKGYQSGFQTVHIEAEIDVDALFEKNVTKGTVQT